MMGLCTAEKRMLRKQGVYVALYVQIIQMMEQPLSRYDLRFRLPLDQHSIDGYLVLM